MFYQQRRSLLPLLLVAAIALSTQLFFVLAVTEVRGNLLGSIPPDMFNLIDLNRDGAISRQEATEFLIKQGADVHSLESALDAIWRVNDRNHDGVISWEEFRGPKSDWDPATGNERSASTSPTSRLRRLRRGSMLGRAGSAATPLPEDAPGYSPRSENPNYVGNPMTVAANDDLQAHSFDEDNSFVEAYVAIPKEDSDDLMIQDSQSSLSEPSMPSSSRLVGKRLLVEVENCQDDNNPSCLYDLHQDAQSQHLFYCTSPQKCFILQLDANLH